MACLVKPMICTISNKREGRPPHNAARLLLISFADNQDETKTAICSSCGCIL